MGDLISAPAHISENIEMYLLRIALLTGEGQPVSVPALAQELGVSPVSANEMCRKLVDRGLVHYEPYKGVTLTPDGEQLARCVLRSRRLWEVFFVSKLGLSPDEAEEIACRFEHVTPELLAEQLAEFLGHPTTSPKNEPIPAGNGTPPAPAPLPLTALTAGERAQVVSLKADPLSAEFLRRQGMVPGAVVEILSAGEDGACLLNLNGKRLALAGELSRQIFVYRA
ncbi:MAG: metal-dependent transcriptional regulator [Chloroflexi bacterium]|nr:MAG: metal-dependent transcriptional regulator [Chloroflexota bacterium]